jgi:hypothetical protein
MATNDPLKEREMISVKAAARTAGVDQRTWLRRMAEQNIPVIWLGPRKRALMLEHFDLMILNLAKPAAYHKSELLENTP